MSSFTTVIARADDNSQFDANTPPFKGCGSVWPSTRKIQCKSGGILAAMSLMVVAISVICVTPAEVNSALPTGNNTSLWSTKRSPTTWMPGFPASRLRSLPKNSLRYWRSSSTFSTNAALSFAPRLVISTSLSCPFSVAMPSASCTEANWARSSSTC